MLVFQPQGMVISLPVSFHSTVLHWVFNKPPTLCWAETKTSTAIISAYLFQQCFSIEAGIWRGEQTCLHPNHPLQFAVLSKAYSLFLSPPDSKYLTAVCLGQNSETNRSFWKLHTFLVLSQSGVPEPPCRCRIGWNGARNTSIWFEINMCLFFPILNADRVAFLIMNSSLQLLHRNSLKETETG